MAREIPSCDCIGGYSQEDVLKFIFCQLASINVSVGGGATSDSSEVVLASESRDTTQTLGDQSSNGAGAAHLIINVTNAGTGSITPKLQGKDANGVYYDILVGAAITSNGINVIKVGRGMTPSPNAVATDQLPRTFRVVITANNANPMTYTVGLELMR